MGCRSYAEFAVKPNMASSPSVVMSFLLEMSNLVRTKADEVQVCCLPYFLRHEGDICIVAYTCFLVNELYNLQC